MPFTSEEIREHFTEETRPLTLPLEHASPRTLRDRERDREERRRWMLKPENREKHRALLRERYSRPEVREAKLAYARRPEVRERANRLARERRARAIIGA